MKAPPQKTEVLQLRRVFKVIKLSYKPSALIMLKDAVVQTPVCSPNPFPGRTAGLPLPGAVTPWSPRGGNRMHPLEALSECTAHVEQNPRLLHTP